MEDNELYESQERSNESPIEKDSAFHIDNLAPVVVIQLARIYDLLAVIARGSNSKEAEAIIQLHQEGITLCPPPSFRPPENTTNAKNPTN